MRRAAIATGVSAAAHAIALALLLRAAPTPPGASTVAVAIVDATRTATPPSLAGAAPTPPTPTPGATPVRRRAVPRARRATRLEPSPAPSAEPQPIAPDGDEHAADTSEDSAADEGSIVSAPPSPPPAVAAPPPTEARPPGLDRATCIDHVDYPWKARLLDKEGMVRLRVVLGSDGRVQQATVVQAAGYGFDETAVDAVKTRCRFTPAYDANGRAVPFVIENYHFYFRLEDFDPQAAMRSWQNRWGR